MPSPKPPPSSAQPTQSEDAALSSTQNHHIVTPCIIPPHDWNALLSGVEAPQRPPSRRPPFQSLPNVLNSPIILQPPSKKLGLP